LVVVDPPADPLLKIAPAAAALISSVPETKILQPFVFMFPEPLTVRLA
jgi:hypothetical protein